MVSGVDCYVLGLSECDSLPAEMLLRYMFFYFLVV